MQGGGARAEDREQDLSAALGGAAQAEFDTLRNGRGRPVPPGVGNLAVELEELCRVLHESQVHGFISCLGVYTSTKSAGALASIYQPATNLVPMSVS